MKLLLVGENPVYARLANDFRSRDVQIPGRPSAPSMKWVVHRCPSDERVMTAAFSLRPDVVIYASEDWGYGEVPPGFSHVADDGAYYANSVVTVARVALAAANVGARLVLLSDSIVFGVPGSFPQDSSETPAPGTEQGIAQLLSEEAALLLCPRTMVARTTWIYGPEFEGSWPYRAYLESGEGLVSTVYVPGEDVGVPTFVGYVTAWLRRTVQEMVHGTWDKPVVHVTAWLAQPITWWEFLAPSYKVKRDTRDVRSTKLKWTKPSISWLCPTKGAALPAVDIQFLAFQAEVASGKQLPLTHRRT